MSTVPPKPTSPALALLPLRVFLGATFVYAGIQKLSDAGFLHPGAPTYIGTQLRGFAHGTPGGFLLRALAIPHPALAGVGVAVTEIAVGLLVLVGLGTRVAALVGLGLNLVLFLTNSWHASPYFLGSDIVFVFAWLPFVLAGTEGQPSLENELARTQRRRGASARGGVTRREALGRAYGAVGVAALGIAGISALLKGSYRAPRTLASTAARRPRLAHHAQPAKHKATSTPAPSGVPRGAVRLGRSNQLPAGQAALYRDPSGGSPDIVVRHSGGGLTAMSAICTHAGCEVQYQNGALFCPCHGSVFNASTGAVEQGPASTPLPLRKVVERRGSIYAVPS